MISLENVTKTYGPVRALVALSCTFAKGSITVLRGPNGSGKSTLLSIVGTMTRPTAGRIDHGELGPDRQRVRAGLGWVGHESLCYPDLRAARTSSSPRRSTAATCPGLRARRRALRSPGIRRPPAFAPIRAGNGSASPCPSPRSVSSASPPRRTDHRARCGSDPAPRGLLLEEAGRGVTVVLSTHDDAFAGSLGGELVTLDRAAADLARPREPGAGSQA